MAAAGAIVVAAPVATAQQPPGSDQYQPGPPPGPSPDDTGGGPDGTGGGPAAGGGPSATVAESGGANLPFTGYPLTPLVLLLLAVLVTGLALRVAAKARERHRAAHSAGG